MVVATSCWDKPLGYLLGLLFGTDHGGTPFRIGIGLLGETQSDLGLCTDWDKIETPYIYIKSLMAL